MSDDRSSREGVSRRDALARIGAGAFSLFAVDAARAADTALKVSCVATPEQTEGPYFIDERLNRSDIRSDPANGSLKEGVPLKLRLFAHAIADTACAPLSGAIVDIWHCDARGVYSDVDDPSFRTVGRKFLRGYQTTAGDGSVEFLTIYPGWYRGRTTHVHFKVRGRSEAGRDYAFTSQLYFDEATSERIYAQSPYAASGRRTRNDDDPIYRGGGKALTLTLAPDGNGYSARFDIGLRVA